MIVAANSNGLGNKRTVVRDFSNSVPLKATSTSLFVTIKKASIFLFSLLGPEKSNDYFVTRYWALKKK